MYVEAKRVVGWGRRWGGGMVGNQHSLGRRDNIGKPLRLDELQEVGVPDPSI